MSELSLNVAPSPELLKAAAGASAPGAPHRVTGAPNPFAALLSGVLQGAQPPAETTVSPAASGPFPDLPTPYDASPDATSLLALPGTAPPLPAPASFTTLPTATSQTGGQAGNPLPGSGNVLPLLAGDLPATAATGAAPPAGNPAAEPDTTPPPGRPRIYLGDLAQSRPVDPAPGLAANSPADGAPAAAAAALAGRSLATGPDARTEARTRPQALGSYPGAGASLLVATAQPAAALPVTDGLILRPAVPDLVGSAGLPVSGTELLAGQLAAFAVNSDTVTSSAGMPAIAGAGSADAGSSTLLGRLGTTGLPPLQPLGDAGAFAGGLADRLLTLGGPGAHSARLKLHPENLGELDVEITMDDGTAQVWFGATTSQARDAIEGSLPRLREMFAEQGIQLTRTQIDSGSGQPGNSGFGQERRMTGGAAAWNDSPAWDSGRSGATAAPAGGAAASTSVRLLDVWA
ncbi:MAG: flagellar hook-length control protein FliK [Gammaproteobacteria bacterium]